MDAILVTVAIDLGCAMAAGAVIGTERSYNGRAAGFRTHAVVALAAAGAMLITWAPQMLPGAFADTHRLDPTRIGQGVMTGVGFLGAGVIFKEGVSVQGLTTAACIWATASIGMLFGLGLLPAGVAVTVAVLFVLVVLRVLENALPRKVYALATFTFQVGVAPSEGELETMLDRDAVRILDVSYSLLHESQLFQFKASLATHSEAALSQLAERLKETPGLVSFDLAKLSR
jgi:putative Mg2+ transporter-C (MgtC) family protein